MSTPTRHCYVATFWPVTEREIFSASIPLPVHCGAYRPCAGLRCGIPLSDYHLRLSPCPPPLRPSSPFTFRLSPCASNRVEMGTSHPLYMHTHILIPVVQWPMWDRGWRGADGFFPYRLYTVCYTLCSHVSGSRPVPGPVLS